MRLYLLSILLLLSGSVFGQQFLRPISDMATNGWTTAPLWSKVNDVTPNDATVIRNANGATGSANGAQLTLSTPAATPSDNVITIRVRAKATGSAAGEQISFALYNANGAGIGGVGSSTVSRAGFTTYTHTINAAPAAEWTNLRVHFWMSSGAASEFIEVTWVEVEVADGAATPITPPTPTLPVTDDVNDTYNWTNSAGYGNVSDYEITENGGTLYTTVTAKPHVVGNVARAAGQVGVRVRALGINNPSATLYNTVAFTFTNDAVQENLLSNPEAFNNPVWQSAAGVSVAANTENDPNGNPTAETITITATGHNLYQQVTVLPSQQYTFSFYVKRGTATALSYSVFNFTTSSNIIAPTSYYSSTSSSWERISVTFTTGATTTSIGVYPLRDGGVTGTVHLWGAKLNRGSSAATYIPEGGISAPTGGVVNDNLGTDTFDWTYATGYTSVSDYEYTYDGGATYRRVNVKPLIIDNVAISSGQLGIRVRALGGNDASLTLWSTSAFTVSTGGTPATNLLNFTEEIDNAYWSKENITVTANADGVAEQVFDNSTSGYHRFGSPLISKSGSALPYTASIKIKTVGVISVLVQISSGSGLAVLTIRLSDNVFGSFFSNGFTGTIHTTPPDANGYVRVIASVITDAATSVQAGFGLSNVAVEAVYTGTGQSAYFKEAQLVSGSSAGIYQKLPADTGLQRRIILIQ